MTHAQWHTKLRSCLALVERKPKRALKSLEKLWTQLQGEAKKNVGEWQVEQTLEVISIVQSHLEDHRHSAETMLRLAERHGEQLSYYKRTFVASCATAALELASAGDRRGALRALRRAGPVAADLRPQEKLFLKARKVVTAMSHRP